MFNHNNHFIDSNVILGFIIDWDGLSSKCQKYFQYACNRYASDNVYGECESVLSDVKDWVLKFIHSLSKKSPINAEYFVNDLKDLIDKTASNLSHNSSEYQKITNVLKSFSEHHEDELRNLMTGTHQYKPFRKAITNAFKTTRKNFLTVFNSIIQKINNHPVSMNFSYRTHFLKRQIHKKDFDIILDAYHVSDTYLKDKMAFITFDKGITAVKFTIEQEFRFKVFEPP